MNKNQIKKKCNYLGSNSLLLSINNPAPVKYEMGNGVYGSYDGLKLIANNNDGWRQEPANVPLKPSDYLFVPQGTPLPLKNEMIYTQLPADSMFYFSHNRARPECCPSTFSTSTGCVCTTPGQRSYIGQARGNNKNYINGSF